MPTNALPVMAESLYELDKKTLEECYARLLRCNHAQKLLQLQFIWRFVHRSAIFSPIIDDMKANHTPFWNIGNSIFHNAHGQILPEDHQDRIYGTYHLIDIMLRNGRSQYPMIDIGKKYNVNNEDDWQKNFDIFNDLFLEPFIFFFLNQSNKNILILGFLKRYKYRTEWVNAEELLLKVKQESSKAEKLLKRDLYRYLIDQGLDLVIEPMSPSGEIDLIALENSALPKSLIEAKIFDGTGRNTSYIIKGFHQAYTYLKDHNENKGYLIIYNIGPTLLSININPGTSFPYTVKDNRTIYFVVVDIYEHEKSASVRGRRDTTEIKETDLQ